MEHENLSADGKGKTRVALPHHEFEYRGGMQGPVDS